MGLKASLQEAVQPDSVAPAMHGTHAVAAKAKHGCLLQLHSGPFCLQGLRMVPPLSQRPGSIPPIQSHMACIFLQCFTARATTAYCCV